MQLIYKYIYLMSEKIYLEWENVNSLWEDTNYLWEDVSILIEVNDFIQKNRGNGSFNYEKDNPWKLVKEKFGEEKTNKVIKIYCKYNNIEYSESIESNEKIKITVSDFEIFLKESIKESISIKVSF